MIRLLDWIAANREMAFYIGGWMFVMVFAITQGIADIFKAKNQNGEKA